MTFIARDLRGLLRKPSIVDLLQGVVEGSLSAEDQLVEAITKTIRDATATGSVIKPSREALVHRIAAELDRPSLYMGGPSLSSRRKAERIVDLLPDYQGAIDDNEKLRIQVAALENDGMELAAKLGEAEEQIARLTASGRQ